MDEEQLRDEIYKRLGVKKGSLSSESGNDWQRAKNEIIEEWKAKEKQENQNIDELDYMHISKDTDMFQSLLKDTSHKQQAIKAILATRNDLNEEDMLILARTGSKEVLINLAKQASLPCSVIDMIINNGVYMAKKYLVEHQDLSSDQKNRLASHISLYPETYDISLKNRL